MGDHINQLYKFTNKLCSQCENKNPNRCCDDFFCEVVQRNLNKKGSYPKTTGHEIRFMGPNGCTVAPKDRPGCTGFVCQSHLEDRKTRRKYETLCRKAGIKPATKIATYEAIAKVFEFYEGK